MAGWGGVIRDSTGQIVFQFSGSIGCQDPNEAEVYAMLMGCHGLTKFDGCKARIEGDSYSSIQWGSGKLKYPWRLANWIEEMHMNMIVRRFQCSFNHMLRDGNVLVDDQAREGVLS